MKSEEELIHMMSSFLKLFTLYKTHLQLKNKTLKIKAYLSICDISIARLDAGIKYFRAGAYNETSIVTQKEIYSPILDYLENELKS